MTRARFGAAAAGEKSELSSDPDALSSRVRPAAFPSAKGDERRIEGILTLGRHPGNNSENVRRGEGGTQTKCNCKVLGNHEPHAGRVPL